MKRHNLCVFPAASTKVMHPDGKPVNIHQKPTALMRYFVRRHCAPGDTALVLGFGSGSEVIGALQENHSVIALEQDERQYGALRSRLLNWRQEANTIDMVSQCWMTTL